MNSCLKLNHSHPVLLHHKFGGALCNRRRAAAVHHPAAASALSVTISVTVSVTVTVSARQKLIIARSATTAVPAAAEEGGGGGGGEMVLKVKSIRVHELGGPEVLKWEDVEVGEPKEGEIRVKHKAIGVNFIDVYYRKGVYKATLPFTPGMEAVGVVTAVGPGLTGMRVGDIVGYAGNPMGSYAEEQIIPAKVAVPVPSTVDPITAASVMLKGMTAEFLVRRCFKVQPGNVVLVHAAAGGVGSLLCQWANALGATVIGTVSSEAKATQATEDGCHHVIINNQEDFVAAIEKITNGSGADVVYDSIGKDTFQGSVACLRTRGYMVSYGQSSGAIEPFSPSVLAAKSLFLTRPSMMQYTSTRDELLESAAAVFASIATGVLRVRVNHTYPLSQVALAHADLESRKTTGSIVLIPDGN